VCKIVPDKFKTRVLGVGKATNKKEFKNIKK
jgi:hypothetical protein